MGIDPDVTAMIKENRNHDFIGTLGQNGNYLSGKLLVDTGIAPGQTIRNVYVFNYHDGTVKNVSFVQF